MVVDGKARKAVQLTQEVQISDAVALVSSDSTSKSAAQQMQPCVVSMSPEGIPVLESLPPEFIDLLARVVLSMQERGIIG